jgi:hypothetical protein
MRAGTDIENQLAVARFLHLYELIQRPYEAGKDYFGEFLNDFNSRTFAGEKLWEKFDQRKIENYIIRWVNMKENPSESIFDNNKFFSEHYPKWYFNAFKPKMNDYEQFLYQSAFCERPDFWHWFVNTYLKENRKSSLPKF